MQLQTIQSKIYELRDQRIILDYDLAELYETETKRLKEAVRRNINRFPGDFMFEFTDSEYESIKSQAGSLRTQNSSSKRGGRRYMPFAFTEQGVAMLSSVLNSPKAIQVNDGNIFRNTIGPVNMHPGGRRNGKTDAVNSRNRKLNYSAILFMDKLLRLGKGGST